MHTAAKLTVVENSHPAQIKRILNSKLLKEKKRKTPKIIHPRNKRLHNVMGSYKKKKEAYCFSSENFIDNNGPVKLPTAEHYNNENRISSS